MKENIMKYINELEGFKTCIKNSHLSANNMNVHKLFDDIASAVSDVQDKVAEISQGLYGKIQKNELKAIGCEMTTENGFLDKLLKATTDFYSSIKDGEDYIGLRSDIESFIGEIQKFQYLMKLCITENKIIENVLHKINISEGKKDRSIKKVYISESAKKRLFNESMLMDKERGKNARAFRVALKDALENNSYEYDAECNKIYIDGFSYELGKKYAEDNNGEPIPLHYTFNSVNKYIMDMLNTEPIYEANDTQNYNSIDKADECYGWNRYKKEKQSKEDKTDYFSRDYMMK